MRLDHLLSTESFQGAWLGACRVGRRSAGRGVENVKRHEVVWGALLGSRIATARRVGPSGSGAWGVVSPSSAGVAWLFENWIVDASRHRPFSRLVFVLHFIRFHGVFHCGSCLDALV